jgi:membrane-associated phospholipid phosphatase
VARTCGRRLICTLIYVSVFSLIPSLALRAQVDAPPDSVSDPSASASPASPSPSARPLRDVSLRLLPTNFLRDQEHLLLFPRELAQGHHWTPTITVAGATLGLLSADPHVQPYFAHTTAFRGFDRLFSSKTTGMETIAVPVAFYAAGLDLHDSYMQKTALFSFEAMADTEVVRMFLNSVTQRWRPQDVFNRRSYSNTFFHSISHVGSSFPSGHTIVAVSVATVIARRYRSHRWIPWAAYGFAGTIALSRITLRAHFPSDVVLGTVLGYAIARYNVLQNQ